MERGQKTFKREKKCTTSPSKSIYFSIRHFDFVRFFLSFSFLFYSFFTIFVLRRWILLLWMIMMMFEYIWNRFVRNGHTHTHSQYYMKAFCKWNKTHSHRERKREMYKTFHIKYSLANSIFYMLLYHHNRTFIVHIAQLTKEQTNQTRNIFCCCCCCCRYNSCACMCAFVFCIRLHNITIHK